jgi:hypothetical protein
MRLEIGPGVFGSLDQGSTVRKGAGDGSGGVWRAGASVAASRNQENRDDDDGDDSAEERPSRSARWKASSLARAGEHGS